MVQIKIVENVPFMDDTVVVIVKCVPKSMESVEVAAKPVPWIVMTVPGMPEAGLTKVIEAPVMQKSVVLKVLIVLTVMVFVPQLWVSAVNVVENIPLELDIVVVMFWCVPKSMVTVP